MRILEKYKAHWITETGNAILSKRSKILHYDYKEDTINEINKFKYRNICLNLINSGKVERFLRGGIHHLIKKQSNYVVFFDKRIFRTLNSEIESVNSIKTCKRPLNICYNPTTNVIYWGDYIASKDRYSINIYYSNDFGKNWKICYSFKKGAIRHIHNIIYDNYNKRYLILTGDKDEESGIWETEDFKTIQPLLVGKQKYRATSLIPLNEGLIIPTDTEVQKNHIQFYSYIDKTINSIMEIPSSSIDAKRINGISLVTTMVEPSRINNTQKFSLFGSLDNKNWVELLSKKKNNFPPKYFQYPSISIPYHENKEDSLSNYYFNIKNAENFDGVIIYSKNELVELIKKD